MRKAILAITAVLLSGAAYADNVLITPADNGKAITLKVGQCLDVRLSTQAASTGYDWYLESGMSERMSLAARTVTTPGGAPPGAPSQLDYVLCAVAPGEVTVKLFNKRIWEKTTPPAKTLMVTVKITK